VFNVNISADKDDASAALVSFKPDIVLCKTGSKADGDNAHMFELQSQAEKLGIPFVAVSSVADVDFYLHGLQQGVSHSIMLPISTEYLTSRIMDILEHEHITVHVGVPVAIEFSYRGKNYSMSLTPSELVQFILSLLHDSVNMSLALSNTIQQKSHLEQRVRRSDIFGVSQQHSETEIQMEEELYRAFENSEFKLYYQPIIDLNEERMSGFEALIRWDHPKRGMLSPVEFISVVERIPLIIPLGFWIVEEAVKQCGEWEKKFSLKQPLHIGINMSANQFIHPELSDNVAAIINNHGVNPEHIAFEITESAFMSDMEAANLQLLKIKSNRHPICMDDFGTGYSSLTYLQHFIVDTVKIDRSFVRWMHMDEQSEQIVRSVVGLAHNLRMTVIAEGVEEDQHLKMLKELGCDYGQGYYFSTPLDAGEAEKYILNFYHRKGR
jgi:EAL domain-containing protein (putative c-di-GMP-specific phosphodiesterase class I)